MIILFDFNTGNREFEIKWFCKHNSKDLIINYIE